MACPLLWAVIKTDIAQKIWSGWKSVESVFTEEESQRWEGFVQHVGFKPRMKEWERYGAWDIDVHVWRWKRWIRGSWCDGRRQRRVRGRQTGLRLTERSGNFRQRTRPNLDQWPSLSRVRWFRIIVIVSTTKVQAQAEVCNFSRLNRWILF